MTLMNTQRAGDGWVYNRVRTQVGPWAPQFNTGMDKMRACMVGFIIWVLKERGGSSHTPEPLGMMPQFSQVWGTAAW